jgi:hypothetical protein
MRHPCDVLVAGDELEGLLTAIAVAQVGARVAVLRQPGPADGPGSWLGGLSTRGGLAYMDLTWDAMSDGFRAFLTACGVKRVSLCPVTANRVLQDWLAQHHIPVINTPYYSVLADVATSAHRRFMVMDDDGHTWHAPLLLDATPDADVARALGEPWRNGLNELLDGLKPLYTREPCPPNYLGISPVFRITGVTPDQLMAFEADCRRRLADEAVLAHALPWLTEAEHTDLINRPCFMADVENEQDYIDMLNPIIGVAFHAWWQGQASTYPNASVWIDGGNIALLPDGSLSFNGMVTHAPHTLQGVLHWSQHPVIPRLLQQAMQAFEQFLQQVGHLKQARVHPPYQLYVRQSVHINTLACATATDLLAGGASHATVGPYSYWLDTRGVNLRNWVPGFTHFAKPRFATSLGYTLCQRNPWLAVLGRSAGYGPLAQGTCRIVQHNAMLGEALAPVLALAAKEGITLAQAVQWPPFTPTVSGVSSPICLDGLTLLQREIKILAN